MQTNIDNHHHELFKQATEWAAKIQIEPSIPRIVQPQIHRANASAATPEAYYRINLTTVFLEHAIQQIPNSNQTKQIHIAKDYQSFQLNS